MFQEGDMVELRSGSQGWIKASVIEFKELQKVVGGYVYGGGSGRYKIRVLEGKHKDEVIEVPTNYVRLAKS